MNGRRRRGGDGGRSALRPAVTLCSPAAVGRDPRLAGDVAVCTCSAVCPQCKQSAPDTQAPARAHTYTPRSYARSVMLCVEISLVFYSAGLALAV